jgi:two-component SAPR family response regulator
VTTVRELRAQLFELDQNAVVTVIDQHLHVDCHISVDASRWVVCIESTGRIVTEEDVA